MKFVFTTIHVKDIDASVAFYEDLVDLKVARTFDSGRGSKIVFLTDGEAGSLELVESATYNEGHKFVLNDRVSIGFQVSDIDQSYKAVLEKGYPVLGDIIRTPTGVAFFYVEDPNGVPVQLIQLN